MNNPNARPIPDKEKIEILKSLKRIKEDGLNSIKVAADAAIQNALKSDDGDPQKTIKAVRCAADASTIALESKFDETVRKSMALPDGRHAWDMRNYVSEG